MLLDKYSIGILEDDIDIVLILEMIEDFDDVFRVELVHDLEFVIDLVEEECLFGVAMGIVLGDGFDGTGF